METELGDLLTECMRDQIGADLAVIGSGSIRKTSLGPIVTAKDFVEIFPFAEPAMGFRISGKQLRHGVKFMLREEYFKNHKKIKYDGEQRLIIHE
jgi:5'-nucleotidase